LRETPLSSRPSPPSLREHHRGHRPSAPDKPTATAGHRSRPCTHGRAHSPPIRQHGPGQVCTGRGTSGTHSDGRAPHHLLSSSSKCDRQATRTRRPERPGPTSRRLGRRRGPASAPPPTRWWSWLPLARRECPDCLRGPQYRLRDGPASRAAVSSIECASRVDGRGANLGPIRNQGDTGARTLAGRDCPIRILRGTTARTRWSWADDGAVRAVGGDFEVKYPVPAAAIKPFPEPTPLFQVPRWRRGPGIAPGFDGVWQTRTPKEPQPRALRPTPLIQAGASPAGHRARRN
jgi:hypothetical protein